MIRIYVERYTSRGALDSDVHVPGLAHGFIDCTDRPAPTILSRPLYMLVRDLPDPDAAEGE